MTDWSAALVQGLKANGIEFAAHVPDEVTARGLTLLEADPALTAIPVTPGEGGVAAPAGGWGSSIPSRSRWDARFPGSLRPWGSSRFGSIGPRRLALCSTAPLGL